MGILDGIVEWIATQVMNILDMINTSVLGALGCDMETFLMYFPADGVSVGPGGGQEKPQRLLACVAAALCHDVVQRAGGLGMQRVKDAGADVETVLSGNLRRKHLIDAARGLVDHALHGRDDLDALHERRGLLDHVHRHVEHDGRLLPVGCTGIDLRLPLVVVDQHIERNGCAQLRFPLLLRYFDVCRGVLAHGGVVLAHGAEHVPDDLLLPW